MKIAAVNFVLLLALISCTSKAKKPAADTTTVSTEGTHLLRPFVRENTTTAYFHAIKAMLNYKKQPE